MVFEAMELDGTASQRAVEKESSVEAEKSVKDKGQSRPEKYTELRVGNVLGAEGRTVSQGGVWSALTKPAEKSRVLKGVPRFYPREDTNPSVGGPLPQGLGGRATGQAAG